MHSSVFRLLDIFIIKTFSCIDEDFVTLITDVTSNFGTVLMDNIGFRTIFMITDFCAAAVAIVYIVVNKAFLNSWSNACVLLTTDLASLTVRTN